MKTEIYLLEEELNKEVEKHSQRNQGIAYITFCNRHIVDKLLEEDIYQNVLRVLPAHLKNIGKRLKISRPPMPHDIIWENLDHSVALNILKRICSDILILIILLTLLTPTYAV